MMRQVAIALKVCRNTGFQQLSVFSVVPASKEWYDRKWDSGTTAAQVSERVIRSDGLNVRQSVVPASKER